MSIIIDCFQDKTPGREMLETDDFSDFVPVITKIVRQENSFKIIFPFNFNFVRSMSNTENVN